MKMLGSRRFILAMFSVIVLGYLGHNSKASDVAMPIATVVVGVAAANSYSEKKK